MTQVRISSWKMVRKDTQLALWHDDFTPPGLSVSLLSSVTAEAAVSFYNKNSSVLLIFKNMCLGDLVLTHIVPYHGLLSHLEYPIPSAQYFLG